MTDHDPLAEALQGPPYLIDDFDAEAARIRAALDAAGYEVRPKLTAERLGELAYADRPPTGPRPVPQTQVKRREWEAWARRILAALDAAT
jgi:hypothetical protein